jgi:cyclic-di-GMP-binding biofilm dispersal mediator protein
MPQPRNLRDNRVLVLGGSGVLGKHIATELLQRGAVVVLAGRDPDRLHANASALGPETRSVIFDLSEPAHAAHVVTTAVELIGGLDGIVNAAGVVAFGGIDSLTDAALDELVAADFTGPLRVMRASLPVLGGGFFVNITGVVAEQPMPGMAAYSAVKAGLSAATMALGRELRRQKIHVLDARPPHTETGLAERPIEGVANGFPEGLSPAHVAQVIVDGLAAGKRELPADAFTQDA